MKPITLSHTESSKKTYFRFNLVFFVILLVLIAVPLTSFKNQKEDDSKKLLHPKDVRIEKKEGEPDNNGDEGTPGRDDREAGDRVLDKEELEWGKYGVPTDGSVVLVSGLL